MRMEADGAALRSLTEAEAEALRSLLLLDRDGDAYLTMDEVRAALAPQGGAT
jgi:hypothetical protein